MELAVYFSDIRHVLEMEEALRPIAPESIPSFVATAFFTGGISAREYYGNLVALEWFERFCAEGHQIGRLYFGQEFCEYLIPSAEQIEKAYYFARQMQWDFTYLTGTVTDAGLDRIAANLRRLDDVTGGTGCEVVVNDWGVLRILTRDFPAFTPLLGRLHTKQLRLARYSSETMRPPVNMDGISVSEEEIREHQWQAFRGLNVDIPEYCEHLKGQGIHRLELDIAPQGVDMPPDAWGFGLSCYYPWGYTCGGRNCLTAAADDPRREFVVVDGPCPQLCRNINRSVVFTQLPDAIVQRGNSVFVLHGTYAAPYLDGQVPVDRIVFEPYIPIG